VSPKLQIIEHPEPDFDLEAELPADLAAMADQLMADADFLTGRYPSGSARMAKPAQIDEPMGPVEAPTLRSKRGGRWWLRAAAIVLMLSGLGAVLTGGDHQPASCPVAADAIDQAGRSAVVAMPAGNEPKLTEVATVDTPLVTIPQPVVASVSTLPKVVPIGVFHNMSGAEQEAFLDFNEETPSLGASVSF
jgi:hypothetical protein